MREVTKYNFWYLQIVIIVCLANAIEYNADGWKAATDFLLDAIDTNYEPCDNFYKYACGKWQEKYAAQFGGQTRRTEHATEQRLIEAINKIQVNDKQLPRYKRSIKTLYDQCMDSMGQGINIVEGYYQQIEAAIGPLPLVEKAKGNYVAKKENLLTLIGKIQRRLDLPIFMGVQVKSFAQGCKTKPLLYLLPAWSPEFDPDRIGNFSEAWGIQISSSEVQNIAQNLKKLPDLGNHVDRFSAPNYTLVTLGELANAVGDENTMAFFKGLFPHEVFTEWKEQNPSIGIEDLPYFQQLLIALPNLTTDDMMAVAYWQALQSYVRIHGQHRMTPWDGTEPNNMTAEQGIEICINKVKKYASGAAVRVLFESYDSNAIQWKNDLEMLAETILSAAKYLMQTADWLDVAHKRAMVERIESMKFLAGIPDWILDDEAVEMHTPNYDPRFTMFENDAKMFKKKFMWKTRLLEKMELKVTGYQDDDFRAVFDPEPVFDWNAQYWQKVLQMWLGAAVPPMYNYTYPLALKYGLVGWVIGHELFHGFHYGHDEWDKYDDVKTLMSPEVEKRFDKRVNCVKKQYSNFCYEKEQFCLSGSNTINDNIADIDGLKVTYMAFKFMSQLAGENYGASRPEILRNYTLDQLFFLSAARVWCAKDGLPEVYKTDVHSPPKARVELSMVNFPAFARAFRCHTGQRFAPLHSCDLWGDFLEPMVAKKK